MLLFGFEILVRLCRPWLHRVPSKGWMSKVPPSVPCPAAHAQSARAVVNPIRTVLNYRSVGVPLGLRHYVLRSPLGTMDVHTGARLQYLPSDARAPVKLVELSGLLANDTHSLVLSDISSLTPSSLCYQLPSLLT